MSTATVSTAGAWAGYFELRSKDPKLTLNPRNHFVQPACNAIPQIVELGIGVKIPLCPALHSSCSLTAILFAITGKLYLYTMDGIAQDFRIWG